MPESKVLLCIPPDYDHSFAPLGTPALVAFLKTKGVEAYQLDLNLGYRDFLISHFEGTPLDLAQKRLLLKPALKKYFLQNLANRYYSKILLRGGGGSFADLPYENNTNSSFYFTERMLSAPYLRDYLEDKKENTFYQFFDEMKLQDFLEKNKINLLAISITSPSQAIASLTLGLLVKKRMPRVHVNIGGQWPTLFRMALLDRKDLFQCFDSISVFEGETPLYHLSEYLASGSDISTIPNIISKNSHRDFHLTTEAKI